MPYSSIPHVLYYKLHYITIILWPAWLCAAPDGGERPPTASSDPARHTKGASLL